MTVCRHGRVGAGAVAVSLALVAGACSTSPEVTTVDADASTGNQGVSTVDWGRCDDAIPLGPAIECATIGVPVDHSDPNGPTIEIALARVEASGDDRIGSLLFNPGGPGGSGIDLLAGVAAIVPRELARRFDLVSFDPRGVGMSAPIDCDIDFDDGISLLPEGDDAGWTDLVDEARDLPERCSDATATLAPFVGTNSAARDLDAIRAALGDEQLTYVGFSYGTRLGATYAELFPDRVRALVFDGAVAPTADSTEIARGQAPAFDRALEAFAGACDRDADCAAGASGATLDVYAELVNEIAEVGSFPTADDDRVLTPGELQLGVVAALYSTQLWPILGDGLADAAVRQDGTVLQALADSYTGRRADGTYDNRQVAGLAVNCADEATRPPDATVRRQAEAIADLSRWFDDSLRADTGCIGTPDPLDPVIIGPAAGAAPILVIGNTGDPATPYEWAVDLAAFLDDAVLYTVESDGHTAFLSVPCVEQVVVDYLVDLELPSAGESCTEPPDDDIFLPPGESEIDQIIVLFDCLRDEGLDIGDVGVGDILTDPSGTELLDVLDPADPAFREAVLACRDHLPGS